MIHPLEPTSDAGHDHQAIIGLDRCIQLLQVADIFAVKIKVDKWTQFVPPVEQVLAQVRMLFYQALHGFRDSVSADFNHSLVTGIRS